MTTSTKDHALRETAGLVLPDGKVVDLVAPNCNGELKLIIYNGEQAEIANEVERDGLIYVPHKPPASVRHAMCIPAGAERGELVPFFHRIAQLLYTYLGFSEPVARSVVAWLFISWVPEYFACLPILYLTGADLAAGMNVFRLLRTLARRAIMVTDLNPRNLPLELQPTLLVPDPVISKRTRTTWCTGCYRDVYLPSSKGELKSLACPKAVYSPNRDASGKWGEAAVHVPLLPANSSLPLPEPDLEKIAAEMQPKFEMFRLRLFARRELTPAPCPAELAAYRLGRELFQLLSEEPEAASLILPLANQHQAELEATRALDPHSVLVEVIWGPAHKQAELPNQEVRYRLNELLQARGEEIEFSAREVGWKLTDLGLKRQRTAKGMVLKFSSELRGQIHQLARQFGLNLPKLDNCSECTRM